MDFLIEFLLTVIICLCWCLKPCFNVARCCFSFFFLSYFIFSESLYLNRSLCRSVCTCAVPLGYIILVCPCIWLAAWCVHKKSRPHLHGLLAKLSRSGCWLKIRLSALGLGIGSDGLLVLFDTRSPKFWRISNWFRLSDRVIPRTHTHNLCWRTSVFYAWMLYL